MNDNDELIASAELGEEARKFLESDLGRCLTGMAMQEVEGARERLGVIDPSDEKGITVLQNHVKVGLWFEQWLAELVDRGNAAMQVFKQSQES